MELELQRYNEIILTGHADGSIKFWDASAGTLQVLYKLKTAKLFEKGRARSLDSEEDPLAIQLIFLCPESRKLAIAGSGRHVVLFKFKKVESMSEVVTLEISLTADPVKEVESSSDHDSPAGNTSGSSESKNNESSQSLKIKTGLQKRAAGFQATLVCLTVTNSGEQAENITALSLNSSYGLMAYGNESGIVIIDIVQKISLIVLNTGDIGGNVDLCQRVLRSPKRQDELKRENEDKARSPSTDQVKCTSLLDKIVLNILIVSLLILLNLIRRKHFENLIFIIIMHFAFSLDTKIINNLYYCMIVKKNYR